MKPIDIFLIMRSELENARNLDELNVAFEVRSHSVSEGDFKVIQSELRSLYLKKRSELKAVEEEDLVEIKLTKWIADQKGLPRYLSGVIVRETEKAILFKGCGKLLPRDRCMACGRELSNPVSIKYGIGIQCGEHWGIDPEGESHEEIIKKLEQLMDFETWLPKSQVSIDVEED